MNFRNFSTPSVQTMKISSMYRHQIRGFTSAFLIKRLSNLSIKMFAYEGAILVPIAVPRF